MCLLQGASYALYDRLIEDMQALHQVRLLRPLTEPRIYLLTLSTARWTPIVSISWGTLQEVMVCIKLPHGCRTASLRRACVLGATLIDAVCLS